MGIPWSQLTLAFTPTDLLDPNYLLDAFGLIGLLAVVFAETGLLVGFFLPGDSLLFTAGLLCASGVFDVPLAVLLVLVPIVAIIGDQVGYAIGRKAGPAVFNRPDSRLFRREHVDHAYDFFEKHGPKTIVLARFVPIVRTFTPVVAGVAEMRYRTFVTYNVIGGILWGVGVTLLGYFLGQIDFVEQHIELILIGIIGLSLLPIAIEWARHRVRSKRQRALQTHVRPVPEAERPAR